MLPVPVRLAARCLDLRRDSIRAVKFSTLPTLQDLAEPGETDGGRLHYLRLGLLGTPAKAEAMLLLSVFVMWL